MSKFGNALKKLQDVKPGKEDFVNSGLPEKASAAVSTASPELEATGPQREKYSTYLDSDLVTALKLHAVRHRMKHHHVVEAALREYLEKRGG